MPNEKLKTGASSFNPLPSQSELRETFVGRKLQDVDAPAAVLDAAVVRRNCALMVKAAQQMGVAFRAHVKTHKTVEIAKLSIGDASKSVRLVASTVAEIEHMLPWLCNCRKEGKEVLYGLPAVPSAVSRLAQIANTIKPGSVGLFVDHPDHVAMLDECVANGSWQGEVPVYVNIDVGDHREGVPPESRQLKDVAGALAKSAGVRLVGVYTHMGSSYASSSPDEAMDYFCRELRGLADGAKIFAQQADVTRKRKLVMSFGATPTATAVQNLTEGSAGGGVLTELVDELQKTFELELHAGVHCLLDLQQLATRARPSHSREGPQHSLLTYDDIGFRILAEVASVYDDRSDRPEALVAAGCIALGREPCKAYSGWGVVTPWPNVTDEHYDINGSKTGWIVGRVSQEHGILTWEGSADNFRRLKLGEKILIWPNHACIAGASFGWYVVVDSDTDDRDIVRDVWIRCRGW